MKCTKGLYLKVKEKLQQGNSKRSIANELGLSRRSIDRIATYIDKIQEVKSEGRVVDSERVTIVAALKISHELLMIRNGSSFDIDEFKRRIATLKKKIDGVIASKDM